MTDPTRLHEMNRLEDMGRFPVVVYVGATANVLGSVLLAWWVHGRTGGGLPAGLVLAVALVGLNLLPVVLLRRREGAAGLRDTPAVEAMDFFRDQHRFASWVYAVASGNLFFWLMLAWAAFSLERSGRVLLAVEAVAFACTFFPVWVRPIQESRKSGATGPVRRG